MRVRDTCAVCGYTGDVGVWHGQPEHTLAICGQCAQHVLPALLADAIDQPCHMAGLEHTLNQVQIGFWKAMTARLLPGRRRLQPRDNAEDTLASLCSDSCRDAAIAKHRAEKRKR
jgi:hypothetical protein